MNLLLEHPEFDVSLMTSSYTNGSVQPERPWGAENGHEKIAPEPVIKILMVDDHPENLLALEASLDGIADLLVGNSPKPKIECIRASNGPDALRKVLQDEYAVILLDVQMPGMDGYETAELIRKRPNSQHTPIIFLTAISTSEINIFHGYSLGAVDYLLKPFDPWILRAKVSVFLDLYRKKSEIQRMADELREHAKLLRSSNDELAKTNKMLGGLYRELESKSQELSKQHEFVDTILETAGSYIIIFDANGRLERFNRASENISGLQLEDVRGRLAWEILVAEEDASRVKDAFKSVAKGETVAFEMSIVPKEGQRRRLSMSFTGMFDDSKKLIYVIASGVDITDRYDAEERIRRMNEELEHRVIDRTKELREANSALQEAKEVAEHANMAKDQFLAVLSHELRTPLTPVLAIVQMLEEDPTVTAETKSWIETIGRNVQLEARLIDDLLDLTRIANGKLELHLEPIDVNKVIQETIKICEDDIRSKKLKISLDLTKSPANVLADSARLQQVLWNLLKNAVKFTSEGGSLKVHTDTDHNGKLRCQVIDSGIGIPPEHIGRVFNAFDQGDKAITRRFGGLGLGLAISRALVEQHHGKIWAESEGVDKGATFTLEMDLYKPEKRTNGSVNGKQAHIKQLKPDGAPFRILFVEDNDDTSRAIQVLLERKGYTVIVAHSVQSALEIAKTYPCDIVISDIGLPDGSGLEVMQKLNAIRPTHGVAVSGFGMDEDVQRSLAAGFDAHLVKPIKFDELLGVVQQLLVSVE
jgi:PAS domain S-box-containing protein